MTVDLMNEFVNFKPFGENDESVSQLAHVVVVEIDKDTGRLSCVDETLDR